MYISSKRRGLVAVGAWLAGGATLGASRKAFAQAGGDVRMLVPVSAGSSVDVIARSVSAEMGKALGQNVYVDNRPGVDSILATQLARHAKPDGKTIVML